MYMLFPNAEAITLIHVMFFWNINPTLHSKHSLKNYNNGNYHAMQEKGMP